ncbi:hypothetical protein HHK36_019683 [Tetracentron sinense]|uniref:Uncharacterized protein n=1 Tax=Tetracentron sinense TaxID=13715 RepID=A0A835DCH9_TETSI|nr:hypothetical protein HHK36_019683 [Tetracentron sinense]
MDDFRSKSYGDGRMQMESYYGGRPHSSGPHDFRSYSASYASSAQQTQMAKEVKFKKGKNTTGDGSSSKSYRHNGKLCHYCTMAFPLYVNLNTALSWQIRRLSIQM